MTVGELIEELVQCNTNAEVVFESVQGGETWVCVNSPVNHIHPSEVKSRQETKEVTLYP